MRDRPTDGTPEMTKSDAELAELVYRAIARLNTPDWLDEPDCWVDFDPKGEEAMNALNARLKRARVDRKMTMKAVAETFGIDPLYYERIEHGTVHMSPMIVGLVAEFCGLDLAEAQILAYGEALPDPVLPLTFLGTLLERERERRGMSQADMGTLWGFSQSSYSRLVNGKDEFTLKRLRQAARFLGISMDLAYQLSETANPEPLHDKFADLEERLCLIEERLARLEP